MDKAAAQLEQVISDDTIAKIEKALNLTLYDWQKAYLQGDDSAMPYGGRRNGKTLAYCVRLALSDGKPINASKIYGYADGDHGTQYTHRWFPRFFLGVWNVLKDGGIKVRDIIKNGKLL